MWSHVLVFDICPAFGCILSFLMFVAPVVALRKALRYSSIGNLEPMAWVFAVGNCWGWLLYGHLTQDKWVMLSNLPGMLMTLFLNAGAIKLQYVQSPTSVLVPQEEALIRMAILWTIVSVYCGWFTSKENATNLVGFLVNVNLMFFYGAPLQIISSVWKTGDACKIHRPTVIMTTANASFWTIYGATVDSTVIMVPNCLGAALGVIQGLLCLVFPYNENKEATLADNHPLLASPPDVEPLLEPLPDELTMNVGDMPDMLSLLTDENTPAIVRDVIV